VKGANTKKTSCKVLTCGLTESGKNHAILRKTLLMYGLRKNTMDVWQKYRLASGHERFTLRNSEVYMARPPNRTRLSQRRVTVCPRRQKSVKAHARKGYSYLEGGTQGRNNWASFRHGSKKCKLAAPSSCSIDHAFCGNRQLVALFLCLTAEPQCFTRHCEYHSRS
jgi:hypothetical protein